MLGPRGNCKRHLLEAMVLCFDLAGPAVTAKGGFGQDLALVVARLSLLPGTLQQRDKKYRVPLAVAKELRRRDMVEILSWAAG